MTVRCISPYGMGWGGAGMEGSEGSSWLNYKCMLRTERSREGNARRRSEGRAQRVRKLFTMVEFSALTIVLGLYIATIALVMVCVWEGKEEASAEYHRQDPIPAEKKLAMKVLCAEVDDNKTATTIVKY